MTEERRRACDYVDGHMCPNSHLIARDAVRQVFAIMDVDVDDVDSVKKFREQLMFSADLHTAMNHGKLAFAGAVAVALCAALWVGIKTLGAK